MKSLWLSISLSLACFTGCAAPPASDAQPPQEFVRVDLPGRTLVLRLRKEDGDFDPWVHVWTFDHETKRGIFSTGRSSALFPDPRR